MAAAEHSRAERAMTTLSARKGETYCGHRRCGAWDRRRVRLVDMSVSYTADEKEKAYGCRLERRE